MKNYHLTAYSQNSDHGSKRPEVHVGHEKPKTVPGQQRRVSSKNQIKLSTQQHNELTELLKGYSIQRPAWLYRRFAIKQRRRKLLNDVLREAGCGLDACNSFAPSDDWAYALHVVSHLINNEPLCNGQKIK